MDTGSVRKYRLGSHQGSPPLRSNKAFKRTLFRNRFLIRIGVMSKLMIRILKILAFAFNVFIAVGGLTMVIVAGYAMKYLLTSEWVTYQQQLPAIILLSIGIFLIIISAFGVVACCTESPTVLVTFIVFLIAATISEIVVGLMAGKALHDYKEYSLLELRSATKVYIGSDRQSQRIDQLQTDHHCCGIEEPSSWSKTFKYPQIPKSCCKTTNPNDHNICKISEDGSNIHKKGCWEKLIDYVENHERNAMAISIILALIQILTIIIHVCLTFGILRQRQWKTVIVSAFKESNEVSPKEDETKNLESRPKTHSTVHFDQKIIKPNDKNEIVRQQFSKKTKEEIESKICLIPPSILKEKEGKNPSPEHHKQRPIIPPAKTNIFKSDSYPDKSPEKTKEKRNNSK